MQAGDDKERLILFSLQCCRNRAFVPITMACETQRLPHSTWINTHEQRLFLDVLTSEKTRLMGRMLQTAVNSPERPPLATPPSASDKRNLDAAYLRHWPKLPPAPLSASRSMLFRCHSQTRWRLDAPAQAASALPRRIDRRHHLLGFILFHPARPFSQTGFFSCKHVAIHAADDSRATAQVLSAPFLHLYPRRRFLTLLYWSVQ